MEKRNSPLAAPRSRQSKCHRADAPHSPGGFVASPGARAADPMQRVRTRPGKRPARPALAGGEGCVAAGDLGRGVVEPARVELDPPLLLHGEVAGQGDDRVGQGDLAAAPGLVLGVVVIVRGVAVADAVGEVLELFAVARATGRPWPGRRGRWPPTARRCSGLPRGRACPPCALLDASRSWRATSPSCRLPCRGGSPSPPRRSSCPASP